MTKAGNQDSTSERRLFLIVSADAQKITELSSAIEKRVTRTTIFTSQDGIEASAKLANAIPNVLITDTDLPRMTGLKLVEMALNKYATENMAMIILSPLPDKEHFVDQVALGQVQFLTDWKNDEDFSKCLARALNFTTTDSDPEFKLRFLAPNDVLIQMGERADAVYVLKRGSMRAYTYNGGEEVKLGDISPGEFVGEMAYINGEPRSAFVAATTDCELIEIPINHLDHVLFKKPSWSKALMETLSRRIRATNKRIAE